MDYAAVARFSTRLSDAMKHPCFFSSEAATTGLGLEFAPVKKSGSPDRAPNNAANNAAIFPLHANLTAEPYILDSVQTQLHFCVPLSCVSEDHGKVFIPSPCWHAQGSHRPEGRKLLLSTMYIRISVFLYFHLHLHCNAESNRSLNPNQLGP